jgi:hypothetical protein
LELPVNLMFFLVETGFNDFSNSLTSSMFRCGMHNEPISSSVLPWVASLPILIRNLLLVLDFLPRWCRCV